MCAEGWADGPRFAWGSLAQLAGILQGHLTAGQTMGQLALLACRIPFRPWDGSTQPTSAARYRGRAELAA